MLAADVALCAAALALQLAVPWYAFAAPVAAALLYAPAVSTVGVVVWTMCEAALDWGLR